MSYAPPLPLNAWLRYDLIRRALRDAGSDIRTVLEIGAGAGAIGARLARRYDYLGLEPDPDAHARAAERLGAERVLCADSSVFAGGEEFDLVCSFEVLEHIEDDRAALADWRDRVRPGGAIALSVPARPHRFGAHDRVVGHYRRYDAQGLRLLLEECGFVDVRVLTCGFPLGYALEAARNTIARLTPERERQSMAEQTAASGRRLQPPDAIGWLTASVAAPFRLLQRPFARSRLGTGLVAVARRPV